MLVAYVAGLQQLDVSLTIPPLFGLWHEGDRLVSDPALQEGCAYFALNHNGVREDGTPAAHVIEGPLAGQLVQAWEVTLVRDATRAVQDLLRRLTGTRPRLTFYSGHSLGAILGAETLGGLKWFVPPVPLRDGGNSLVPYDASSPTLFQAAILMGMGGASVLDPSFPLVPMWMIQGEGDSPGHVRWVNIVQHAIAPRGESIADWVSIQEVRNMPHNFPEVWFLEPFPPPPFAGTDQDRVGPVVGAAIRNLRDVLKARRHGGHEAKEGHRAAMAASHFGGVGVDLDGDGRFDQVVYEQGATTTDQIPLVQDASLDAFVDIETRPRNAVELRRWQEITAVIPPTIEGLVLPWSRVRLGGYDLDFTGARLARPFPDLCDRYNSFDEYAKAIRRQVRALEREGAYVPPAEKDAVLDPLAAPLFEAQGCLERE